MERDRRGPQLASEPVEEWRALERAVACARLRATWRWRSGRGGTGGAHDLRPGPRRGVLRYVEGVLERLGHVPAMQGFALHVLGHMRARLGEFEGALRR